MERLTRSTATILCYESSQCSLLQVTSPVAAQQLYDKLPAKRKKMITYPVRVYFREIINVLIPFCFGRALVTSYTMNQTE